MPPEAPAQPPQDLDVTLLSPTFWPEVRRGAERIVRELANGLIERGHRPRLITSHPGRPSRRVEEGLDVVRNWRPPQGWLLRRQFEDHLTQVPFTYASLLRHGGDVAQAVQPGDAVAAARWSKRTGRPAILAYMGIPRRRFLVQRRLRADILMRAVRGCAAVTTVSHCAADAFARTLGVRARVIYPGVDLSAFVPGGERAPEPTIFCAAPIEQPQKRVDLLVRALPIVQRERPSARLVLLRPDDVRLAADLESRPGIELLDMVADEGLAPAYRDAWVSALPGRGESFGLVIAEALACGTVVVASRSDAIPELIDRAEIGCLFEGDDESAVAAALLDGLELAEDPHTAAACRGRAEDFSFERCVESYIALYRELLA